MITQETLKNHLSYDKDTGQFTRIKAAEGWYGFHKNHGGAI